MHRTAKIASLTLIGLAILCSVVNAYRAATIFENPVGLALNALIIIFLLGGLLFIVRDPKNY
jgi:hypothetical protein